jgi:hypothetical protein
VSIDPVHQANWTDEDAAAWERAGHPDPWKYAPYRLLVEYVAGQRDEHVRHDRLAWRVRANSMHSWNVYPPSGRWPMCSCCGEPVPCRAELQDQQASWAMQELDKFAKRIPGQCWACEEPVTHRQEAVSYAGINLDYPGGPQVVFHTRRKCFMSAVNYEKRWLEAEPGRDRILTYPLCGGTLLVHQDGTSECVGGGEEDCQGANTHDHRSLCACYMQSHGCGRGCSHDGHPGTRFSDRVPRYKRRIGQL